MSARGRKAATNGDKSSSLFPRALQRAELHKSRQACGVSQPSVSNAIKRLEEELGGDLFHRTKKGAKLSPLGVAIRPYLDQINECAEGARREAAYILTADMVSIPARAKFVRKLFYGTAIPACALFIGVLFGHQPNSESASREYNVDVAALEATIDIKHLPRQDVSSEVYQ